MTWSYQSDQPIYAQLAAEITARIVAGVYPPGEKLPSVRDFAAEAGVNPNTMQRALTQLEQQGLVFSQRTAGRFVTEEKTMITEARQSLAKAQIQQFLLAMRKLGYAPEEMMALLQESRTEEEQKGKEASAHVSNPHLPSP